MDEVQLNLEGVKQHIKIRYPVLMVDKATVVPGIKSTGYKYLTGNESFWQGHYPEYPMMPGTYQLEAMAQVFSLTFLLIRTNGERGGYGVPEYIPRLVGFDKVRFFKEVLPGNVLKIHTELESLRHGLASGSGSAFIDDICVCSAKIKTKIE